MNRIRISGIAVVLCMLINALPAVAAEQLKLPVSFTEIGTPIGTATPFKPAHKYGCMQNPPDFTWPMIDESGIKWDLIVCSDEELTDIKYSKYGLDYHYYNFPEAFEPGTYYWAVRYTKGGKKSEWSAARRFRIDPDAYVFTVPESDEIADTIPVSHPRIWFTEDTIDEFRKKAETETGKKIVESMISVTESNMLDPIDPEPTANLTGSYVTDSDALKSVTTTSSAIALKAQNAALSYIFTGDTRYADYAVKVALSVSEWDVNGVTSYKTQDQAYFEIILRISFVYDWMYNYMTDEQRTKIRTMLKARWDVLKDESLRVIRKNPYDSHMWSYLPNLAIASIALLHDEPEVEDYYKQLLPMYIANFVPMSNEDGGWSKGTAYWTYAVNRDKSFIDVLQQGGYLNVYNKAWCQNEYLWAMYALPAGSVGSFGDASGLEQPNATYVMGLSKIATMTNNPVAAWVKNQVGQLSNHSWAYYDAILAADADEMEEKVPISYPRSHLFPDQGIVTMHSDLIDKSRISLYFRSSKYGSYNHMHADQNSFIIEAFGEPLAIKSGYYDSYHSTHDSGFTRKTYAHNSVTVDGGKGQKDDDMNASGNIDMFVTHPDFDAAVGDATKSYNGVLNKFVRSIVYVRPDTYIVIDDLKSANDEGSSFEWWLNAADGISLHEDGMGASVKRNRAALDARVQYPEKVSAYYTNLFSGPDLIDVKAEGTFANSPVHKRIWFETEQVPETKIITTMNVHKSDEEGAYVKSSSGENYVKLEFEDGTVAFVSTATDENAVITAENLEFKGTAAVFNDKTVMLVGGTSLKMNGKKIVEADRDVTAIAGIGQISISSNDDCNVSIGTDNPYVGKVDTVTDRDRRKLSALIGVELIDDESFKAALSGTEQDKKPEGTADGGTLQEIPENADALNFKAQKGSYSFLINDTGLPGEMTGETLGFDVIADGVKTHYEGNVYFNGDYEKTVTVKVPFESKKYVLVSKTPGISVNGVTFVDGGSELIDGETDVTCVGDGNYIELKSIASYDCEVEQSSDYEGVKAMTSALVEAEDFETMNGSGRLTQGIDHMLGVSKFNNIDSTAKYTITVPESGYYDLAIRYSSWLAVTPKRSIEINGSIYNFDCPDTGGYGASPEDFKALRIKSNIYLEAGEHTFILGVANSGTEWNYDWIGLIKN